MSIYLQLFLTYAKVGVMTFGGGYAMLPILKRELVDNKKWITEEEIVDSYAIGQCTPGIIAVNVATLVGYNKKGVLGAVCSTLGVIFPSIVIILAIASLLSAFSDNVYVKHAFGGINVAVCAIVTLVVAKLFKTTVKDWITALLCVGTFALTYFVGVPAILCVVGAALAGLIICGIKNAKAKKSDPDGREAR